MKYAAEVIDLMSAYPGREFRMVEIVRYVAPRAAGQERQRVRNGVLRVLAALQSAGSVTRDAEPVPRGCFAAYAWAEKVPQALSKTCTEVPARVP